MKATEALEILSLADANQNVTLIVHDVEEPDSAVLTKLHHTAPDELERMLKQLELNKVLPHSQQMRFPRGVTRAVVNNILSQIEEARNGEQS